jgi:hypothetical protein
MWRMTMLARGVLGLLLISSLAVSLSGAFASEAEADTGHVSSFATSTVPQIHDGTAPVPALAHQITGLTPVNQAKPHSHAVERVGGLSPHDGTGKEEALNLTSNWSGAVEAGSATTFTEVQGDWVVPAVSDSASDEASGTWIGIDGVEATSLIQTGTAENSGPDYGGTQYYAWVELLPGAPGVITNTSTSEPAPVEPGDVMSALIMEDSTGVWTIDLDDITQNWSFTQQFTYNTPGLSAEWIEEAPTVNNAIATLPDYGSTTFSELGAGGTDLSSALLYPFYMVSQTGAILSYPADFATDSFSVFYGSPSPQVTSISPDQGSTSGGASVNIGGNFVTGVTSVNFGGVSVPFTADLADGTVSASAPPQSAGTVDITVTTPGGTSQLSSADQFTYVAPPAQPPPPPVTSQHGYSLVGSDGGIFSFGSAQFYGSTGSLALQRPVVGIVPTKDHGGYWLDASDGGVFSYGDTQFYGSIPGLGLHPAGSGLPHSLNAPIVGMVPSADDGGYFMVASDGGVFAFGDAHFAGSCPGMGGCSGAAVSVMPDASGNGYWLVTKSGSVYTFGDASYYGAPGNTGSAVTSAVRTPNGGGYWILTANGTVYNYGNAGNYGDAAGTFGGLNPAAAIFTSSDGGGYWIASANGTVDQYGDAPNDGGMSGSHLNGSIIAATGF